MTPDELVMERAYRVLSGLMRQAIELDDGYDTADVRATYEALGERLWPSPVPK